MRTPGELSAFLVAAGCLPMMEGGAPRGRTPIPGRPMTQPERAKANLTHPGETIGYLVGDVGVFLDFSETSIGLWFQGGDAKTAIDLLTASLARFFPELKQVQDGAHPHGGRKRLRVFEGPLARIYYTKIEVDYPEQDASGPDATFVVRMSSFLSDGVATSDTPITTNMPSLAPSEALWRP